MVTHPSQCIGLLVRKLGMKHKWVQLTSLDTKSQVICWHLHFLQKEFHDTDECNIISVKALHLVFT